MRKKTVFTASALLLLAILATVCIFSHGTEYEVIQNYDKESAVAVEGTDGCIRVKEKKYDYDGADVMILSVENQTENAYTVLIKSYFTTADGTKKQMIQRFAGLPAGYQNYFVFQPKIRFIDYEFEIVTQPYSGETLAEHISWGTDISVEAQPFTTDFHGNPLDEYITYFNCFINKEYEFPVNSIVSCTIEVVLFDNLGEIYLISNQKTSYDTKIYGSKTSGVQRIYGELLDTPWKDYKLPPELKGDIKGIVALNSIVLVEE